MGTTLQDSDIAIEDSRLTTGWYRIDSVTGNDIVNGSVTIMHCGTVNPLWMNGEYFHSILAFYFIFFSFFLEGGGIDVYFTSFLSVLIGFDVMKYSSIK